MGHCAPFPYNHLPLHITVLALKILFLWNPHINSEMTKGDSFPTWQRFNYRKVTLTLHLLLFKGKHPSILILQDEINVLQSSGTCLAWWLTYACNPSSRDGCRRIKSSRPLLNTWDISKNRPANASESKHVCRQAWWPDFNSQNPHGARKNGTPASCPLTHQKSSNE